jgi:nucleoside-triphosphatase
VYETSKINIVKKNILIGGIPHSGKSTQIQGLVVAIENKVGFLTKEIKHRDERVGFKLELFNGRQMPFAHVIYSGVPKVSKYGVKVENLDLVLDEIPKSETDTLLYVDEIGEMQLFSEKFKERVMYFLKSQNTFVATYSSVFKSDFIDSLKHRADVILVEVTEENREETAIFLKAILRKIEKAKKYLQEPWRFNASDFRNILITSEHGIRTLSLKRDEASYACNCDFFGKWGTCSHYIAADELFNL